MLKGWGLTWAVVLVAFGFGVTTARAEPGTWSAPQTLGQLGYLGAGRGSPLVGDEAGDSAVVWTSPTSELRVARARAGHVFGAGRLLSRKSGAGGPMIAMDQRGDVIVAWEYNDRSVAIPTFMELSYCCDHVVVATLPAGSARVRYQDLSSRGRSLHLSSVALAADGSSDAVAYESEPISSIGTGRGTHELLARVGRVGRAFGRGVALGSRDVFSLHASAGRASLLLGTAGEGPEPLHEAVVTATGRRTPLRVVHGLTRVRASDEPEGYDAHGDQAMLVVLGAPNAINYGFATRRPGGPFRVQRLASEHQEGPWGGFGSPALAVSSSGRVLATWTSHETLIVAGARLPDGRLGRETLGPVFPGLGEAESAAAIDSQGQGVIVAKQSDPAAAYQEGEPLLAVFRSPRGRLYPPALVGRVDVENATRPAVVIDARGRGVAVWQSGRNQLEARRFRVP
jgi:hypothetical protein